MQFLTPAYLVEYRTALGQQLDKLSAINPVRAAMEMLAFVKAEVTKRSVAGEPWCQIPGLYTDPVVAGVVGESKFAYHVWGDTVNTAARLEQRATARS